jgi:hypothetical protein
VHSVTPTPRPAEICRQLLSALDASEGRRRRRKRDTRPDAIGLEIKRRLLEATVTADPEPDAFEGWLLTKAISVSKPHEQPSPGASGPVRAMALDILAEWKQALSSPTFRDWLGRGAPSADVGERAD